jgi:branched-chain amino acid transport system substrate-binding protein
LFINTNGEPVRLLLAVLLSFLASAYGETVKAPISDTLVRIGVLNDQSGVYADFGGPGSVIAGRMAVEDAGGKVLDKPIDVVVGDHQGKADVSAAIARQWFDSDRVDMAIGFDNSSVALAVEQVALQKNRIAIAGAVATTAFTCKNCTPNEVLMASRFVRTHQHACSMISGRKRWRHLVLHHCGLCFRPFARG